MKLLLVILSSFFFSSPTCIMQKKEENKSILVEEPFKPAAEKTDFIKQVQPVLVRNCSPCHFTGGKMYDRMPFDKDTTFLNHSTAILKRIKNEEENAVLKKFAEENKQ